MGTLTSTETPRIINYSVGGTASAGPFDIPFTFRDEDIIAVYIDGTETTAFGVTQTNEFSTSGNTLTLETAVSNATVTIASVTSKTRLTTDTFTIADLSEEIDNLYTILQEQKLLSNRVLQAPVQDGASIDMALPSAQSRAGKYLKFNSTTGAPELDSEFSERITISTSFPSGGQNGDVWFMVSS